MAATMPAPLDPARARRRRRGVQATAVVLAFACVIWLCYGMAVVRGIDAAQFASTLVYVVTGTLLGPVALGLVEPGSDSVDAAMLVAAGALWTAWFAALFWTRFGELHWRWHLIASAAWCLLGLLCFNAARVLR